VRNKLHPDLVARLPQRGSDLTAVPLLRPGRRHLRAIVLMIVDGGLSDHQRDSVNQPPGAFVPFCARRKRSGCRAQSPPPASRDVRNTCTTPSTIASLLGCRLYLWSHICGRMTLTRADWDEVLLELTETLATAGVGEIRADEGAAASYRPRYNVAPARRHPILRTAGGPARLGFALWWRRSSRRAGFRPRRA
jgi:hypothetical protein